MVLFDFFESLDTLNNKITAFLEKNGNNPLFWSILVVILFLITYWGIQYFNKK